MGASSSSIRRTPKADMVFCLDTDTIDDSVLNLEAMRESVEIEFLGRGMSAVINQKHWAWLIKGNNFFCTIEYGAEGIVVQYFERNKGIDTACAAIMGDSKWVYYDDKFQTSITFGEIVQYVLSIKTSWTANDYHSTNKNCRDFVRVLGRKLDSQFNPPEATTNFVVNHFMLFGLYDITFPKYRSIA